MDDGTDPFNSHREPEGAPADFDTADWRDAMNAKYADAVFVRFEPAKVNWNTADDPGQWEHGSTVRMFNPPIEIVIGGWDDEGPRD
jgi:hypothetical protein